MLVNGADLSAPTCAIDPYRASTHQSPKMACLAFGRSLSQFRFHVAQAVLLDADWLAEIPPDISCTGPQQHQELAIECLRTIRAALASAVGADAKGTLFEVALVHRELVSDGFRARCSEALEAANDDLRWTAYDELDEPLPGLRTRIVDLLVAPLIQQLSEAMRGKLSPDQCAWVDLGEVIEQGLCRPDVEHCIDVREPTLLCIDPWSRWRRCELEALPGGLAEAWNQTTAQVDKNARRRAAVALYVENPEVTGVASRNAGDLSPSVFWADDLRRIWKRLDLPGTALGSLSTVERQIRGARLTTQDLRTCVGELFEEARTSSEGGACPWRIDLDRRTVELNNLLFEELDPECVYLLYELTHRAGRRNAIRFEDIKKAHGRIFLSKHRKLREVRRRLPEPINRLIDAKPPSHPQPRRPPDRALSRR
jgi:hypothetical protein